MVHRSSPAITPDFFAPSMRIALICFRLVSRVSGKPEQRIVANSGEWRRILENRSKQDRHRYLGLFATIPTILYSGFPDTPRFPLFDLIHCEA